MDEGSVGDVAQVGVVMKQVKLFAVMAFGAAVALASIGPVRAEVATPQLQRVAAQASTELSAQRRIRRRATPIYIYGHRPLSPTAVRACVDWYAYEYRPSGTVIVPKMSCHWIDR
jgi:hypothetical protein